VRTSTRTAGRTTRRRGALLAGGAALVAGLLGACAGTPGAAAVVDGDVISTSELQAANDQLRPLFPGVTLQAVLSVLIQEPVITELAQEHGVGVSDGDARALLATAATTNGVTLPADLAPGTVAVARYVKASTALSDGDDLEDVQQQFSERIAALDIELNPRFGTLDADANIGDPAAREWLVTASAS